MKVIRVVDEGRREEKRRGEKKDARVPEEEQVAGDEKGKAGDQKALRQRTDDHNAFHPKDL